MSQGVLFDLLEAHGHAGQLPESPAPGIYIVEMLGGHRTVAHVTDTQRVHVAGWCGAGQIIRWAMIILVEVA